MLNANLFAQMGAKPKSMAEYGQEMDTDALNALKIRAGGLEYQNALQAQQDDQSYRELAKTFSNDPTANYNALMQKGLYKQAQGYQKSVIDAEKDRANANQSNAAAKASEASAAKTQLETHQAKIGTSMKILQAGTNPMALVQMLDQSIKAGVMTREEALQAVSDMPQDPQGFAQWRDKQLTQGMDMAKRLELQGKQANDLMIPDPANPGKYIVNQALLGAQIQKARAGASSTNVSYGAPVAGVDEKGNPVFFQPSKGGGPPAIVPGVRPTEKAPKALTEGQAKANLFGTRMDEADRVIADLEAAGVTAPSILQQVTGGSGLAGAAATAVAKPEQQQIDQAQRDFINAVLRRESGAAISAPEFENARRQYFVQPGDSAEVIAQKARNRKTATQGMLAEVPENMRGIPGVGARRPAASAPSGSLSAAEQAELEQLRARFGKK